MPNSQKVVSRNPLQAVLKGLSCPTPVGFAKDIRPLFTADDVQHMKFKFNLTNYNDVKIWAHKIYSEVSSHNMPPPGSPEHPWSDDKIQLFGCWVQQGCNP